MAKPMAPDPAIGTWKLNVDKSSFKLTTAPKSSVLKVEAWEDGLKLSVDTVDAQGNKLHPEAAYKFDGNDYPIKGSPLADTVSAKRINERSNESIDDRRMISCPETMNQRSIETGHRNTRSID